MVLLLLAVTLVFFATDLLKAFKVSKQAVRLQHKQHEFRANHAQLLREAAKLSNPATFAQSAKLQRMAIFQEKEADKVESQQVALQNHWLNKAIIPGKAIVCLAVVLWSWRDPVAYIDIADVSPLQRWLSTSANIGRGNVACAPALAVSQIATAALTRVLVPQVW